MCGIVGIVGNQNVAGQLYDGLTVLQHRGQDAAGIATAHGTRLRVEKGNGLVRDVFDERRMALLLQFIGEHVQQHFAVRIGVDVAAVGLEHLLAQRLGVDQVAVVRQRDAVRRVDVERLRLVRAFRTGGRVAHMGDADATLQQLHAALVEYITDQAVGLFHA